jgi:hypothetical protein
MDAERLPPSPALRFEPGPEDVLLIALSAMMARGHDRFHFERSTAGLPASKLFLRDPERAWYHKGLKGLTRNLDETADFLREFAVSRRVRRLVVLGASSGGYAALVLGRLLEANAVHAVSPRTFLDAGNRARYGEVRLERCVRGVYAYPHASRAYFDLAVFFAAQPIRDGGYHLYYCDGDPFDRLHAGHVGALAGLNVYPCTDCRHGSLAVQLLRRGILRHALLSDIAAGDAPVAAAGAAR